jgi:Chaperone of endosialidase/Secretion system C-terminal sorting domain
LIFIKWYPFFNLKIYGMKKILCVAYATTIFGVVGSKAQTNSLTAVATPTINTAPVGVSQFQVSGKLITQNSTPGAALLALTDPRITGNFGVEARWNSMGNLKIGPPAGIDTLNGFRAQTNGRAMAWGHKKSGAVVSNSFIEWIGNTGTAPITAPGNLEFRWAAAPTGGVSNLLFVMKPSPFTGVAGIAYSDSTSLIGQRKSGAFGSFGIADRWSITGQIATPTFNTYGTRQQFEGYTLSTGLLKNNTTLRTDAIIDFGNNGAVVGSYVFKFRSFNDPLNAASVRNVWQSSTKFANIVMGRQDYFATNNNQFYMSLFDGTTSAASNTSLNFIRRAGIYACTDGNDEFGNPTGSYASIVGDVSGAPASGLNYGILGIAVGNYAGSGSAFAKWAGYFIGDIGYTGNLTSISDRKFKTNINDEEKIMNKIMLLKPKNYLFDVVKNKNMALSNKLQHGLISQEVEEVFPELVQDAFAPSTSSNKNEDGKPEAYKGLNYIGFIPMLIKGLQEQQLQIEDLKKQLETKSANNTLVLTEKNSVNLPAEIENKAFSLSQNTPNPFSEKTTISYSLPADVNKALLAVFDLNGKMLLQFNLQNGKNQQVQVNGNTLSAGMYIYSIIANGQEVISKRMILTK